MKRYFFSDIGNDGKAINKLTNSKKDTQNFTLELKGQTCVRIHDNNKESISNPLNYFNLLKRKVVTYVQACKTVKG